MTNSPRNSLGNVRSDMDIAYPEHLSRLHRHSVLAEHPKSHLNPKRNRRGNRYRTQPVTFDEIQEVDEENAASEDASLQTSKMQFFRFSKSLNHKRNKMSEDSVADGDHFDTVKSNGEQSVSEDFKQDQLSWTDYTREGSV